MGEAYDKQQFCYVAYSSIAEHSELWDDWNKRRAHTLFTCTLFAIGNFFPLNPNMLPTVGS